MFAWLLPSGSDPDSGENTETGSEDEREDSVPEPEQVESDDPEPTENVFLGTSSMDSDQSTDAVDNPEETSEKPSSADQKYMNQSENGEEDIQQPQSPTPEPEQETGETQVSDQTHGNPENGSLDQDTRETVRSPEQQGQRSNESYKVDSEDTYMELPDQSVTNTEEPDPDATVEKLLPESLPGWQLQKTDQYRWIVESADEWITATYRDPLGDRYMVHISRWQPEHVQYVVDELYCMGKPADFDIWTARGRYVFAVKIDRGTVEQAKTLLAAAPPLSLDYLNQ